MHSPSADIGRFRILVVDDCELNRSLTEGVLSHVGDVVCVGSGAAALEALDSTAYDLILMDLDMPVCDGHAATRAIRQRTDPRADVKVVAFSARPVVRDGVRAIESGMDGYLARPIPPLDLVQAVKTLLNPGPVWNRQDYSDLVGRLGDGRMRAFLACLRDQCRETKTMLQSGQPRQTAILRIVHDLASTSGMMGFRELSTECHRVQETGFGNKPARAAVALERALCRAVLEMDRELAQTTLPA